MPWYKRGIFSSIQYLKNYKTILEGGCWIMKDKATVQGYFYIRCEGKKILAHKLMWENENGKVPLGLELGHKCNNRRCFNPEHVRPITHKNNCLEGSSFSAINSQKTHCPKGHEYNEENTTIDNHNRRVCKICKNKRNRFYNTLARL